MNKPICNRLQMKGDIHTVAKHRKLHYPLAPSRMIYTILQLVQIVSVLIDLINEELTTIGGMLKGRETLHIQEGCEARTAHTIA
jgi:hypothetical protein